jgi:GNAT superfamily N-acetyltransferase
MTAGTDTERDATRSVHHRWPEQHEEQFELLMGSAVIAYVNVIDCGHEVWIAELRVHPDHRGNGHGTELLQAVFKHYPHRQLALSCTPIGWATEQGPLPGAAMPAEVLARWYSRHGFRPDGENNRMVRRPPTAPSEGAAPAR